MTIFAADAATYTVVASGAWSSSATWQGGTAPGNNITGDEIIIGSGFTVDLDQDVTIASAILVSGSLEVDGTLSSTTSGRTLTFTGGNLRGSGVIDLSKVRFQLASTIDFTGQIHADEMENTLSLVTSAQVKVRKEARLLGGLTIAGNGKLEFDNDAWIIINGGSLSTSGSGSIMLNTSYSVWYQGSGANSGSELSGSGLKSVVVDVGAANSVQLSGDVSVADSLSLVSGTLALNGHHLKIMGDLSANGSGMISSDNRSDLFIEGSGMLSGTLKFAAAGNTVRNMTVNRSGNDGQIRLGSDLKVSGILNLSGGHVKTGNYVLDITSGGSITGASKDRYIVLGTSGRLGMNVATGGAWTTYPVGTEERYMPAAIKNNASAAVMIRVNAINEVYADGTSGSDLSDSDKLVKGSWNVTSETTAGLDIDMKLMWMGSSEVNGFNREMAYISHYTSGSWDLKTGVAATAEADGMYSVTRSQITSLSPFAVKESFVSGIADVHALSSLNVYPNPARDYIMINNNGPVNIEIVNELGQVVKRSVLSGSTPLNLADLERGNYFVRISDREASIVRKFIKL